MSEITQLIIYKTSDGNKHDTEEAAKIHQDRIDLKAVLLGDQPVSAGLWSRGIEPAAFAVATHILDFNPDLGRRILAITRARAESLSGRPVEFSEFKDYHGDVLSVGVFEDIVVIESQDGPAFTTMQFAPKVARGIAGSLVVAAMRAEGLK